MMELSHSLILNEEALSQLPSQKRPIFIFEWLQFLEKILAAASKVDIKEGQKQLVSQLIKQMNENPGPPTRKLIAHCLATLFSIGDTFLLFDTVNKCNDILKNRDDSLSYLPTRLAAVTCIGTMYEKLGRMMGRSYEETVQILIKTFRAAESQLRIEIMLTLVKITAGMGTAASNVHKDIFKVAKLGLTDRALTVRSASALCLVEMTKYAPFMYTLELENICQICYRAFDGANYDARCDVAKLLGVLLAATQKPSKELVKGSSKTAPVKLVTLEEALGMLLTGFLRGGSSFLKGTGEMIKGSSSVSRETRVGITYAYDVFIHDLGSLWLERHVSVLLLHLAELVSNPKTTTSHVDAVYSRKCVNFILRSSIGRMLGEKAQIAACKEITQIIIHYMNTVDIGGEGSKEGGETSQHILICLLQELGNLFSCLSTTSSSLVLDNHLNLLDALVAVLLHPISATRLAAAWCLRCVCSAVPSQLHPMITRCCDRLESLKSSAEAVAGYSSALAALLGCVQVTALGIPHMRGKILFNIAEELLRSASQNSRLSIHRTQAGWLIIGSVMTLGIDVVRGLLPRMLLLWKNSFPRSSKEIESEKSRGDAFTWQVTLEGRAGALSSMYSFLLHCSELAAEDTIRRLLLPIEAALLMLSSIGNIIKQYGQHLKASSAMVRLRLFEVLSLLPPQSFESHYANILKLLVSEFTLAESVANTTTSLLQSACCDDNSGILSPWLYSTDHKLLEDQLQLNSASGSGALEHDFNYLYRLLPENQLIPGPLPLGVAVIDSSVVLFGQMFPLVASKHRLKILKLFGEMIRATKSQRQEAIQINIFTAILHSLKNLGDQKGSFDQDDVKEAAATLILGGLTHTNHVLRFASAEAIGRMAQVVGDPRFVADMIQNSFDRLKCARDAVSRTGHSLALGCLHRYVGGMGSGQHLNTSISILLALAKDSTSPLVQLWALRALTLIADSGGPMFRAYVEPSLSVLLELLLFVSPHSIDVHQCIGKCMQTLVATVGPELQGTTSSMSLARWSLLCGSRLVGEHHDPLVQAESILCLQEMHVFAPRHVNLSVLVPMLVKKLNSKHLLLRRASVSCLRQLSQREAYEVCEHASAMDTDTGFDQETNLPETGLPGLLFGLLDVETDAVLIANVHCTLTSMLHALAMSHLGLWLTLCREVLTSATDSGTDSIIGEEGADDDDMVQIHAVIDPDPNQAIPPRWRTRVFAAQCISKIIHECSSDKAHFDLALAREKQSLEEKGDFLVLHLSEIVRIGFMGATSDSDQLRLEGLQILHLVIEKFAHVPEPEFVGHVILEQYQAQVGAALRPAFAPDTPSHITARACEVCSAWICSGVARDLNDLRRVHHLLVSSLAKLNKAKTKGVYNESAETLEKLAILKAWAEVYIVAVTDSRKGNMALASEESDFSESDSLFEESILNLVSPELVSLSNYWLAALKDHALLSLPAEFCSQLPHSGGAFYSNDCIGSVKKYYSSSWYPLLYAAALWLNTGGFDKNTKTDEDIETTVSVEFGQLPEVTEDKTVDGRSCEAVNTDYYFLILGICMEWLCNNNSSDNPEQSILCLKSVETLIESTFSLKIFRPNPSLSNEIAMIMHRQLLSCSDINIHQVAINVVSLIVSLELQILHEKKKEEKESSVESPSCEADLLGEGGESGEITAGQSLVFTALQISMCVLLRYLPGIAPEVVATAPALILPAKSQVTHSLLDVLLASIVNLLISIVDLCSPAGGVAVLPTVLYLVVGVLKEYNPECKVYEMQTVSSGPLFAILNAFATLSQHPYSRDARSEKQWCHLLQSGLAAVIDLSKTSQQERITDDVMIICSITQIILHSPPCVGSPHNIQYPAINLLKLATEHPKLEVRIHCIRKLKLLFSHKNEAVSLPYIHALAPRVLEYLYEINSSVSSQNELQLIEESFNSMELLLPHILVQHRGELVGILVVLLIGLLQPNHQLASASSASRQLHNSCLAKLQKLGPEYPLEFKNVLATNPELKCKLQAALEMQRDGKRKPDTSTISANSSHQPSIILKTDFSNFS